MEPFDIVFMIQIIALCICAGSIWVICKQKSNELSRQMLLVAFAALMCNAGYLLELLSKNSGEVMIALRCEYIGVAFAMTFTLLFISKYCEFALPMSLYRILLIYDFFVVFSVWSSEWNHLYYTNVSFDTGGFIPHAVLGRGPLYLVTVIIVGIQMCASILISGRFYYITKDKRQKRSSLLIWLSTMMPILAYCVYFSKTFEGFDPIPMSTAFGIFLVMVTIFSQKLFNLVTTAHENIIQNMDTAVIIMDTHLGFSEANVQARKLFPVLENCKKGTRLSEVEGVGHLFSFDIEETDEISIGKRIYSVKHTDIHSDGIMLGKLCILYDITDERIRMQHIRTLKEEADRANQAKSEFLALMSHELRTPINAIMGMDEMILRESAEQSIHEYATDIENAAKGLLSIVNDILDASKIEYGKMDIVPDEYELGALLKDVFQMQIVKANDKKLALTVDVSEDLPTKLIGDDNRIRQILLNLLSNAIKYTHTGSVCLSVAGKKIQENKICLHFKVIDTGIGIKAEDIPRLFQAFERIDLKNNYHIEGTGLGITITQKLLNLMDSNLHVESTYGEGSTFYFDLIQTIVTEDKLGDFSLYTNRNNETIEEEYKPLFTAPDAKILVVDDNATNCCIFKNLLKQTQIQITDVNSGDECLERITQNHYDVIFLDYMMPDMDGHETLQRMKLMEGNLCKETPVVMLTGDALAGSREKYLQAGFNEFLAKPIIPLKLEQMLESLLPKELLIPYK